MPVNICGHKNWHPIVMTSLQNILCVFTHMHPHTHILLLTIHWLFFFSPPVITICFFLNGHGLVGLVGMMVWCYGWT